MHTGKKIKTKIKNKKSHYIISALAATIHPPPGKHLNYMLFKKRHLQEGNSAQAPSSPDKKN
jgi:hypothetical protein